MSAAAKVSPSHYHTHLSLSLSLSEQFIHCALGTLTYPDGSRYTGELEAGMRHGEGTFTTPDNIQYTGKWEKDKRHGVGVLQGSLCVQLQSVEYSLQQTCRAHTRASGRRITVTAKENSRTAAALCSRSPVHLSCLFVCLCAEIQRGSWGGNIYSFCACRAPGTETSATAKEYLRPLMAPR